MKKKTLYILIGLMLISSVHVRSSNSSTDFEKVAIKTLFKNSSDTSFWVQIHALEFLCELGYKKEVRNIIEKNLSEIETIPQKRIGYWRCLFKTETNPENKKIWLNKILNAYTNPTSNDKIHAAETLAKLNQSLKTYPQNYSKKDSIYNNTLNNYINWGLALPVDKTDSLDYNLIFSILNFGNEEARKTMAYGIPYMSKFTEPRWNQLVEIAMEEPLNSSTAVYLLSAAVSACPSIKNHYEQLNELNSRLLILSQTPVKANKYESYISLGKLKNKENLSIITQSLTSAIDSTSNTITLSEQADVKSAAAFAYLQMYQPNQKSYLTILDWIVIALFLLFMLIIGYTSSRKTKIASDYTLGGKNMNPIMIGVSLFATLFSSLSYLSYPGEMIKYGPWVFTGLAAFPVANWIVSRFLIPKFMKMNVTSAYEILEIKLGHGTRMLASLYFLTLRFLWMSTIIYATVDAALIPILGLSKGFIPIISIVLVLITVIYTTMGGLKAVVITDVLQSVVMFAGAIVTIIVVLWKIGSIDAFCNPDLYIHWTSIDWSIDITKRMTIGNIFIMTLVWQVATSGSDQMAIQRYLATKDAKTASKSYRISLVTSACIQIILALVGFAVMAYFVEFPNMMKEGTTIYKDADTLFPRFILIGLPTGITGLIAAAIMAAAMSSLSSGLNSSSTVIQEDIINRNKRVKTDNAADLRKIKLISALIGVLIAFSSYMVTYVSGNLFDVVVKVVNLVVAPLFVLFFMALFIPFATNKGTICGGIFSLIIAILISFFEIFNITALWIMPISLITGIIISIIFSFLDFKITSNIKRT